MDARFVAYRVLAKVEKYGAYSNLALIHELNSYEPAEDEDEKTLDADRRLATEIIYGTLRNQRLIDVWIKYLSGRQLNKIDPAVLHLLRLSLYQLLFLDRMPAHAVLSEAGRILRKVRRNHAVGFTNALLRRWVKENNQGISIPCPKNQIKRLSIEQSIPMWIFKRWIAQEDENDEKKLLMKLKYRAEQANKTAPLSLLVNPKLSSQTDLISRIEKAGGRAKAGEWANDSVIIEKGGFGVVAALENDGLCYAMDEAAQIVVQMLEVQANEKVLDVCAAPGGKSVAIAGKLEQNGALTSIDISPNKVEAMKMQFAKRGFKNVETLAFDMREMPELPEKSFDKVLVDAPCSALGLIRRHPEIRYRRQESDIQILAETARQIAENALKFVRPGGTLVFSVCTNTDEEGIEQLKHLTQKSGWICEKTSSVVQDLWKNEENLHWITTDSVPNLDSFFAFRLRAPE